MVAHDGRDACTNDGNYALRQCHCDFPLCFLRARLTEWWTWRTHGRRWNGKDGLVIGSPMSFLFAQVSHPPMTTRRLCQKNQFELQVIPGVPLDVVAPHNRRLSDPRWSLRCATPHIPGSSVPVLPSGPSEAPTLHSSAPVIHSDLRWSLRCACATHTWQLSSSDPRWSNPRSASLYSLLPEAMTKLKTNMFAHT